MTGSIKKSLLAACAVMMVFGTTVAMAQDTAPSGPRQLFIPRISEPAPATPDVQNNNDAVSSVRSDPVAPVDGIGSSTLGLADPESFGLLNADQGGLGVNMWRGTPRALVETLLPELPRAARSPVTRDLARRLLTSSATAPAGRSLLTESLLAQRITVLAGMGELDAAFRLAGLSPLRRDNHAVAQAETDARLLLNDMDGACSGGRTYITLFDDVYWQKLTALCQLVAGETGKAGFALNLARDIDPYADDVFYAVMDKLLGAPPVDVPDPIEPNALQLAAYRAAGSPVPQAFFDPARIDLSVGLTSLSGLPADQRLMPAERAARIGALDMATLRALYTELELPSDALADPLALGLDPLSARTRAVLYRAVDAARVSAERAELLAYMLRGAQEVGYFPLAARISADQVSGLPVTEEFGWFAPLAVRVFLVDGDLDRAEDWLQLWRDEAVVKPDLQTALDEALPIFVLGGLVDADRVNLSDDLATWTLDYVRQAEEAFLGDGIDGRAPRDTALLMSAILTAVGTAPSDRVWPELLLPPFRVAGLTASAAVLTRMDQAATDQRAAETIMMALLALGDGSTAEAGTDTLARVISALATAGLPEQARLLGLETALAAGL